MTAGSIFLRDGCLLPDGLGLKRAPFNHAWTSAGDISSAGLDVAVRSMGWHFMWIEDACSRFGCGRTEESASNQAITRALRHVGGRFNAAEVDSARFSTFPGFRIAKVTVHTRQIQQDCTLGSIDLAPLRQLSAQ